MAKPRRSQKMVSQVSLREIPSFARKSGFVCALGFVGICADGCSGIKELIRDLLSRPAACPQLFAKLDDAHTEVKSALRDNS